MFDTLGSSIKTILSGKSKYLMSPHPTQLRIDEPRLAQILWKHERQGRFLEGLECLPDDWASADFLPDTNGLSPIEAAELRLRYAVLLGYQGHIAKIAGSQLRVRDLLTDLCGEFVDTDDHRKAADCENHLALTYWRTGEFSEARVLLRTALERPLPLKSIERLASIMYVMLVNVSEHRYDENVEIFTRHEDTFRNWGDDWITSSFYVNAGIGFFEIRELADAQRCFELAQYRATRSSIDVYLGSIENELAHVYKERGRTAKAHLAVDRGIAVFRRLGDISREGMLFDTKAAIFLDEGKLDEAIATVNNAIELLKDGENNAYLAESHATASRILIWQDDLPAAVAALLEATEISRLYSGERFSKTFITQFENELKLMIAGQQRPQPASVENDELSLLLSPELSQYTDLQAIRISNDHLSSVGILNGSLVMAAVNADIRRGDIVAITHLETNEINCGFYDNDFGIICLERCDGEPELFDAASVKVIGKIIGRVATEKDDSGCYVITPVISRPPFPEI
jgi:tetratricopeptide (TPR) repeat protein